ncbi:hypothetical protein J7J83_01800 [bacterium]|nr:hypothetical protein [bacterium]
MELSLFLAQVMGISFVVLGCGFLCNSRYYKAIYTNFVKNESLVFVISILMLVLGSTLVLTHNIWEGAWWVVLITILGWIILIKGFLLAVFPKSILEMTKSVVKWKGLFVWAGILYATLGVIFLYYGFIV